jgi:hypothetical protein
MFRHAGAVVAALALAADAVPTADVGDTVSSISAAVASPAPPPAPTCTWGKKIAGHYLDGWCQSLAPVGTEICGTLRNGTIVPSHWPYDTTSLAAAQAWCCAHVSHCHLRHLTCSFIRGKSGSSSCLTYLRH